MRILNQLMLVCAALYFLPATLSRAGDIKAPIRGLVSMGAYRFVGKGGDPVNTLAPLNAKPGIVRRTRRHCELETVAADAAIRDRR